MRQRGDSDHDGLEAILTVLILLIGLVVLFSPACRTGLMFLSLFLYI